MDVPELIQARHFTRGRLEPVRAVVIHTTESPCEPGVARRVAEWFAGPNAPAASAHYVVGPDEVIACVAEEDVAWHAPPANAYAIGIEHTAMASFAALDWASAFALAMLTSSAVLVAGICSRYGIPVVYLDEVALLAGASGITTHACVSRTFRQSSHVDPGLHFPLDDFLAQVRAKLG